MIFPRANSVSAHPPSPVKITTTTSFASVVDQIKRINMLAKTGQPIEGLILPSRPISADPVSNEETGAATPSHLCEHTLDTLEPSTLLPAPAADTSELDAGNEATFSHFDLGTPRSLSNSAVPCADPEPSVSPFSLEPVVAAAPTAAIKTDSIFAGIRIGDDLQPVGSGKRVEQPALALQSQQSLVVSPQSSSRVRDEPPASLRISSKFCAR